MKTFMKKNIIEHTEISSDSTDLNRIWLKRANKRIKKKWRKKTHFMYSNHLKVLCRDWIVRPEGIYPMNDLEKWNLFTTNILCDVQNKNEIKSEILELHMEIGKKNELKEGSKQETTTTIIKRVFQKTIS